MLQLLSLALCAFTCWGILLTNSSGADVKSNPELLGEGMIVRFELGPPLAKSVEGCISQKGTLFIDILGAAINISGLTRDQAALLLKGKLQTKIKAQLSEMHIEPSVEPAIGEFKSKIEALKATGKILADDGLSIYVHHTKAANRVLQWKSGLKLSTVVNEFETIRSHRYFEILRKEPIDSSLRDIAFGTLHGTEVSYSNSRKLYWLWEKSRYETDLEIRPGDIITFLDDPLDEQN